MHKFKITFEMTANGLRIESENMGFTGLELIGLLELKKSDILKQIEEPTKYNRTSVYEYGKKDIIEDKEK